MPMGPPWQAGGHLHASRDSEEGARVSRTHSGGDALWSSRWREPPSAHPGGRDSDDVANRLIGTAMQLSVELALPAGFTTPSKVCRGTRQEAARLRGGSHFVAPSRAQQRP